ncbi:MAG TPA: hypothetical protein VEL03_06340 [Streptosporangiaceae bacterium]|nr:hypothetical protein [Streptosporangiaceae bacterium]
MALIDDEAAIRAVLADMTSAQPPAPPGRYAAVRRRAAVHHRRQLAGAAAVVAVLVAAAIAIPLGLVRIGPPAPQAPRHYHVSVHPPGRGSAHGLVGYGTLGRARWMLFVDRQPGNVFCWSYAAASYTGDCTNWPPPSSTRTGAPAFMMTTESGIAGGQVEVGYARSDVTFLRVDYTDGQVLTVQPEWVFGSRYASFFGIPAPYPAAVTRIIAYSRHGEIGYAVPFTGQGTLLTERWLRPGQRALPAPAAAEIGSGRIDGTSWRDEVRIGPWGTCFVGVGSYFCFPTTSWAAKPGQLVSQDATAWVESRFGVVSNEVSPQVAYLILTTARGQTTRVRAVPAGGRKFFAYAMLSADQVVRWAAYAASGQLLGSGRVSS